MGDENASRHGEASSSQGGLGSGYNGPGWSGGTGVSFQQSMDPRQRERQYGEQPYLHGYGGFPQFQAGPGRPGPYRPGQVVHYPGFYSPYGTPYHMYGDMARGGLPHMQFPHLQPPFQPGMVPPGGRPPFGGDRPRPYRLPMSGIDSVADQLRGVSLDDPQHRQRSRAVTDSSASFDFSLTEAQEQPKTARKTIMIRNIPNKYTQKMLLNLLNRCKRSPEDPCYDFFYLPIDFKNRCNLGYAFVNFLDVAGTVECYKHFHSKRWEEFNSRKVCVIKYARVQGKEALVNHFRNSKFPSDDQDCLPVIFNEAEDEEGRRTMKLVPLHVALQEQAPPPPLQPLPPSDS